MCIQFPIQIEPARPLKSATRTEFFVSSVFVRHTDDSPRYATTTSDGDLAKRKEEPAREFIHTFIHSTKILENLID